MAVASSEPLTSSGGPLRSGQQLFTKLSCSLIFFTCSPVAASHARTDLSGDALSTRSPSVVHCTSRTAFLCPAQHSWMSCVRACFEACGPCNIQTVRVDLLSTGGRSHNVVHDSVLTC